MSRTTQDDAFQYRVDFAASVISSGERTTRNFDNCFEMYDGDAVAVAVYRRAMHNPKLRRNIWRYITRESVVKKAWASRRKSRADLKTWAAELRAEANRKREEENARWMAEQEAVRARATAAGYTSHQREEGGWLFRRPDGSLESVGKSGYAHTVERDVFHYACKEMDAPPAAPSPTTASA
jgi:tRNA-dihydrouridine synthase